MFITYEGQFLWKKTDIKKGYMQSENLKRKTRKFSKKKFIYAHSVFGRDNVKSIKENLKSTKRSDKKFSYRITKGIHDGNNFKDTRKNKGKVVYRIWTF